MRLRVQSAGRIDDQHVEAARLGLLAGIVGDGGRVRPLLLLHNLAADPLTPDCQLFDGGGPEGIAGGDDDLLAFRRQPLGEFGDARRLAGPVHAGDEHDGRPTSRVGDAGRRIGQQVTELLTDEEFDILTDFLVLEALPDAIDDQLRRGPSDVGEVKLLFELCEKLFIDAVIAGEEIEHAGEDGPRLGKTLLELRVQSAEHGKTQYGSVSVGILRPRPRNELFPKIFPFALAFIR